MLAEFTPAKRAHVFGQVKLCDLAEVPVAGRIVTFVRVPRDVVAQMAHAAGDETPGDDVVFEPTPEALQAAPAAVPENAQPEKPHGCWTLFVALGQLWEQLGEALFGRPEDAKGTR